MIDPGVYYNLKSAQEIMRKQTQMLVLVLRMELYKLGPAENR